MKANELRIGNYVVNLFGKGEEQIDYYHLGKVDVNPNMFKPIPLTEEWLIKFSAIPDLSTPFFKLTMPRNIGYIHYNPNNQMTWLKHHNSESALNPQSLFYLHQLQNLYFALTGEELEVNL